MSEKHILCTYIHIVWEIWGPIQETQRFDLYLGDSQVIQEGWHRCCRWFTTSRSAMDTSIWWHNFLSIIIILRMLTRLVKNHHGPAVVTDEFKHQ